MGEQGWWGGWGLQALILNWSQDLKLNYHQSWEYLSCHILYSICETQPPASIGWGALSSVIVRRRCPSVPHSDISSYLAQIKKFQKTKCIYFWILVQGGPPHPVNWSPSHSTGPQTPFLTDISVTVAQIKKIQKTKCQNDPIGTFSGGGGLILYQYLSMEPMEAKKWILDSLIKKDWKWLKNRHAKSVKYSTSAFFHPKN